MEVDFADAAVMGNGMMLGEVISQVVRALFPVDAELALADPISNPVEAHVDGFRAALFDAVIDDAVSYLVVGLDRCGRLGMAKSF